MATISNLIVNMIARTANFEAGMLKSKNSVKSFQSEVSSSVRSIATIMKLGVVGRFADGIIQGFTSMHKAIREGQDALSAFVEELPVLGIIEKSFVSLYGELSGFTQKMEEFGKGDKALDDYRKLLDGVRKNIEVLNSGTGMEKQSKLLQDYQDKLNKLLKMEAEMRASARTSNTIKELLPAFDVGKMTLLKEYKLELKKINDELEKMRMKKWLDMDKSMSEMADKIKESIKTPKEAFESFGETLNNLFIKGLINIDEWKKATDNAKKDMLGNDMGQRQSFQEINPSMINVSALYPSQNPIVSAINETNNLLRRNFQEALS